ncbi:helix-turn-helix domain-containing protein [Streptomyces sp. NPDC058266]|uniref:helix-turn-helix domain-containing protein n=1 Tax=Streptomyces sp. NPDC058266 TaxID=3346412 RepID=UPI0036E00C0B
MMTERELSRRARHRLAVLRHVEEVSGSVAATCCYYGISRQCYYVWLRRYDSIEKGTTHHAAIVTAVMPDGEIKYTQHTDSYQNVSLEGRINATEKHEGAQNVRIVGPNPD